MAPAAKVTRTLWGADRISVIECHNAWVDAELRKADTTPARRTLFEQLERRLQAIEGMLGGGMKAPDSGVDADGASGAGGFVKRYALPESGERISVGHVINITRTNKARLAVASDTEKFGAGVCTDILKTNAGQIIEYQCGGSLIVYVAPLTTANSSLLWLSTTRPGYLTDNPSDYTVGKKIHQNLGAFIAWSKASGNTVSASVAHVDFTYSPPANLDLLL